MSKNNDLNGILARNLAYFMEKSESYKNPHALGKKANVAPNTVGNYLDHTKRTTTSGKLEGFPTVDILARLADALGCQVWELLHPNLSRAITEREMYKRIEASFADIKKADPTVATNEPEDPLEAQVKTALRNANEAGRTLIRNAVRLSLVLDDAESPPAKSKRNGP